MKRGYPRPKFEVGETTTGIFKNGNRRPNGNWGKKWNNRTYPLPYTSEEESISTLAPDRMRICVTQKRCVACGEVVEGEYVWIMPYNGTIKPPYLDSKPEMFRLHSEAGPFHEKCLKLTMTMCPHIAVLGLFMAVQAEWSSVLPKMRKLVDNPYYDKGDLTDYPRLDAAR